MLPVIEEIRAHGLGFGAKALAFDEDGIELADNNFEFRDPSTAKRITCRAGIRGNPSDTPVAYAIERALSPRNASNAGNAGSNSGHPLAPTRTQGCRTAGSIATRRARAL